MRQHALTLGLVMGVTGPACAQPEPAESLLGGPPVEVVASAPTLVERDYEGALRPLEVRPEVAAVGLLGLTDDERAAVDALINQRAALADRIASDNRELLNKLRTAAADASPGAAGDNARGTRPDRTLRVQLQEALQPMLAQEPLAEHLAGALPAEQREAYRAIVAEWYEVSAAEAGPGGERASRRRSGQRGMQAVRVEIRNALERSNTERTERLDSFIAKLGLDIEQEGEVRAMIRAFNEANRDAESPADRSELMRQIFALLDPEQQQAARQALRADRP